MIAVNYTAIAEQVRLWGQFAVVVIGAAIGLRTYVRSRAQVKVENSLRLLDMFDKNLYEDDIGEWTDLSTRSVEPGNLNAKAGCFRSKAGHEIPFDYLFSEGPDDSGATERIVEQLDILCYEVLRGTAELRLVYARLGQLMTYSHRWLSTIDSRSGKKNFVAEHYPSFDKVMRKHSRKFENWPSKTWTHNE